MFTQTGLTAADRERRCRAVNEMMARQGLDGLLVCGDGAVKFLAGEYVSCWGTFALYSADKLTLFMGGPGREYVLTPVHKNLDSYWTKDFRILSPAVIVAAMTERGLEKGKIGVTLGQMSAGMFQALKTALPEVEFVDIGAEYQTLRRPKSGGELALIREAVDIVDTCVRELPDYLHTGMYEYEVKAAIENRMIQRGAEGSLILINADPQDVSSPAMPTDHKPRPIQQGDLLVAEVTVCYRGYWVQKIVLCSFGEPAPEVRAMFRAVDEAIWIGADMVRPGVNAKDVLHQIDDHIEKAGFLSPRAGYLSGPQGHLSGLDLDEGTFRPEEDFILQEGMLFVLHPGAALPGWTEGKLGIFGPGTMFLVTADGCESLNKTPNELFVIDR